MKTWRQRKRFQIVNKYRDDVDRWADVKTYDDRILFVNMYRMVLEAINSLPENPSNLVCVAMNDKINEYIGVMDEIKTRFAGR